mgnify:CR=1 FL=1
MVKKTEKLYMELSALENRGVTIWLEGTPSNSLNVSNQLSIHEDTSYMRDYVFEEGRLKEVHFDNLSFCKWRLLTFILVTYYIVDIVYA